MMAQQHCLLVRVHVLMHALRPLLQPAQAACAINDALRSDPMLRHTWRPSAGTNLWLHCGSMLTCWYGLWLGFHS